MKAACLTLPEEREKMNEWNHSTARSWSSLDIPSSSTRWITTNSRAPLVVDLFVRSVLFWYSTSTVRTRPSLVARTAVTIPNWYRFSNSLSLLLKRTTSPTAICLLVVCHLGWGIRVGTWLTSQPRNHALKIFSLDLIICLWSSDRISGAVGHLLLFLPKSKRLGVIKSRFSNDWVLLPTPMGRLLMLFDICCPRVSHCRMERRCFCTCLLIELLTSLIFRSTFPWT